jgi:hypothetical protein
MGSLAQKLRWVAVAIIGLVAVVWALSGANTGWTKTSVPVSTLDEVTGIEGIVYQRKFVPGLDLLALGSVTGAALFLGSFLLRNRSVSGVKTTLTNNQHLKLNS